MKNPFTFLNGPAYSLENHIKHIKALHEKYEFNSEKFCTEHTLAVVDTICKGHPLAPQLAECIQKIFEQEDIYCYYPPTLRDKEWLQKKQTEIGSSDRAWAATETIVPLFEAVFKQLPEITLQRNAPTVPLYVLTKHYPDIVNAIITFIGSSKYAGNDTFATTTRQLTDNAQRTSGIDPKKPGTRKVTLPQEYDGDVTEAYLWGTPFYDFFQTPLPFVIDRKIYAEHGAMFARTGHGKSQTLRAIVASFLQEEDPPALFIMDSLGSLIDGMADLEVFAGRLKDRLVIIDPSKPEHLPALNFFQLQSDDLCFYLFKAIDQSFTQRQSTMISYLMEFMRTIPNANLLTLIQVCEARDNPFPNALANLSPFAQSFFANQFFAKKPDQLVQQTKSQIAARIYTLARMPKFNEMFSGTSGQTFDPFRCMQEKKICLINTDARPTRLGGLGEASAVFGRFILAQCLDAARGRPKDQRHLALLIVDEAKAYMDDQTALILSDARQFGLGMFLATQFPHQLEEGVRREINTNTSIKFMGPVEYAVASQYARDMFTRPEFIMGMKAYDRSHAEWAAYVANLTDKAVRLSVKYGAIEAMPKALHPGQTTKPATSTENTTNTRMLPPQTQKGPEKSEPPLGDKPEVVPLASHESRDTPSIADDDPSTPKPGGWKTR